MRCVKYILRLAEWSLLSIKKAVSVVRGSQDMPKDTPQTRRTRQHGEESSTVPATETSSLLPVPTPPRTEQTRSCLGLPLFPTTLLVLVVLLGYAIVPSTWAVYTFTVRHLGYPGTVMFPVWILF